MKITCRYSGIEFEIFTEATDYETGKRTRFSNFSGWNIPNGVHPVFNLPISKLLEQTENWAARKLSPIETRLLFLSLLHSTELITFRNTASPEMATIEKNMELLIKTTLWMSNIADAFICHRTGCYCSKLHLPRYVVSHEAKTFRLESIGIFLDNCNYIRDEWYKNANTNYLRDKLTSKEDLLNKLIKSSTKNMSFFAGRLAEWAIDASGIPPYVSEPKTEAQKDNNALRDLWKYLFKLRGWELYTYSRPADLDELLDHMQTELRAYAGTILQKAVLDHLRLLVERNKKGISGAIQDMEDDGVQIIEDDIEMHNKRIIAAKAPEERPTEDMVGPGAGKKYKTRIEYFNALSAWKLAKSQEEQAAQLVKQMEERQKANLQALEREDAAITTEEETVADVTEDEMQVVRDEFASMLSEEPISTYNGNKGKELPL